MIELKKEDWTVAKDAAERALKQALIDLEIFKNMLDKAEKEIKKFPEDEKTEKQPLGV